MKLKLNYKDAPKEGDWVLVYNHYDNDYGFDKTVKIQAEEENRLVFYGLFGTHCLASDVTKIELYDKNSFSNLL